MTPGATASPSGSRRATATCSPTSAGLRPDRVRSAESDPPFRWFKPRDLAETAIADEGYRAMTSFVRQARRHLAPGARMLIFGTSGDMGYLKRLMAGQGFSWAEVVRLEGERDGVPVDYVTLKVT